MLRAEHLTRQLDIIPLECLGERITIIGAGAVGSWTALALAKMGLSDITVFDHDMIDPENLNCQFYPVNSVGQNKALALRQMVEHFTGVQLEAFPKKYEGGQFPGIVIAAVDNMAVRRLVWEEHAGKAPHTRAIIDPRMGAEGCSLRIVKPMDAEDRQSHPHSLYTDEEAVQERCTAKATIYTANLLAGLVCKAVKDLITGKPNYLKRADWDIAQDDLIPWHKGERK